MLKESNAIEGVWSRYPLIQAHRAWKYIIAQDKLTTDNIKETHRLLMRGLPLEPKYRGDWRDVPVMIGGQVKAQPKIVIDSLMRDWCMGVNVFAGDPVVEHIAFENIHPFIDGNGRIGRILMNWQSVKKNNELVVFTEKEKFMRYYPLFRGGYFNSTYTGKWGL